MRVVPFSDGHVEPAGRLLAARHAEHRRATPLLDPRFAAVPDAAAEVARVWASEGASGSVVLEPDDEVAGYLLGAPRDSTTWGPNVWVEAAGLAVSHVELIRELYASSAQQWVDAGRTAHYVVVPAHDESVAWAWFGLGFGQQHVHALRDVPPRARRGAADARVRRALVDDIAALALLDLELPRHQGASPVFSSGAIPSVAEAETEWAATLPDHHFGCFVAESDGVVVGSAVGCPLELSSLHSPLMRPAHAGFLGFAAVFAQYRGHGLGRALGEAVLDWCAESGFAAVATDWRATNLHSSRAWPRLGFEPSFLRLHRVVGY